MEELITPTNQHAAEIPRKSSLPVALDLPSQLRRGDSDDSGGGVDAGAGAARGGGDRWRGEGDGDDPRGVKRVGFDSYTDRGSSSYTVSRANCGTRDRAVSHTSAC